MRVSVGGIGALIAIMSMLSCTSATAPATSTNVAQPASGGASATSAPTASGTMDIGAIASLSGANRQATLEAGARSEGGLTWYTGLIVDQIVQPIANEFQAKYPYIKVDYYRANSADLSQRLLEEHRAGQDQADVTDTSDTVPLLKANDLLQAYTTPSAESYPADLKDKDHYWVAAYTTTSAIGYNTNQVSKDMVPKTYQDLLDPKWKGKMAWNTSGTYGGPGFIGNILTTMGQDKGMEYLKALSQQDIVNVRTSTRAVTDSVIAGEYPMNIVASSHHVAISASQGAPVAWQPVEPVLGAQSIVLLLKHAHHPYAAMLLVDFLASEEGQKVFANADYLPALPSVPAKYPGLRGTDGGFKVNNLSPEVLGAETEHWNQIYQQLFVK